ncbi:hypothetical protein CK507_00160 [Pseudomonas sp. WN033]|nr:hypothetical protein CK507_00160 [Pseudomonas sp. WN033]
MFWFWRTLASLCLGLATLGVVLPGLPTTPFLLVAAWAGARGWPELEARLLAHPHYGPLIRNWREHRAVPRRAKWLASALMLSSVLMIWLLPAPQLLRWLLPAFLLCVALWLWTRPEPSSHTG